jgi:hypothetical protein
MGRVGEDTVAPVSHEAEVQSSGSGEVPFSHSPLEITLACVHGGQGREAGGGPSGRGKLRDTVDGFCARAEGAPGGNGRPLLPPILYPRWGVRPEEQMVRFRSRIDPFRAIPPAPIQDVMVAATLARLCRGSEEDTEERLWSLADAREKIEAVQWNWNRPHGSGR